MTEACPECGTAVVAVGGGLPWCPACEWNLHTWDPWVLPARGSDAMERRAHDTSDRIDRELYDDLSIARPATPVRTAGGLALAVAGAVLTLVDLGFLVTGIALLIARQSFWLILVGVVLLVAAVAFRPRLGRGPRTQYRIEREDAPRLFDLIAAVCASLGARLPHDVVLDVDERISLDRHGLRRRTVLRLGGQQWAAMTGPQRVAVLAHELAHTVASDPSRTLLVAPVLAAAGALAAETRVDRTLASIRSGRHRGVPRVVALGQRLAWPFGFAAVVLNVVVRTIGRRAQQRAEYLADSLAADVAGTDAVLSRLDRILLADEVDRLADSAATHRVPAQWAASVDSYLAGQRDQLELLRQHDARRSTVWDVHPPAGRRERMLQAWPRSLPRVTLTPADSAHIDAELGSWIRAVHREILGTRDFHDRTPRPAR